MRDIANKNTSESGCGNNTLQFVCHCQRRDSVVLIVWHLKDVFQTCFDSSTILTAVFKPHFQRVSLKWAVCEKLKWWNTFQFIRSLEMADWRHYLVLFASVPGVRKKGHHNSRAFKTTGCAQSVHNKRHMSRSIARLDALTSEILVLARNHPWNGWDIPLNVLLLWDIGTAQILM